MISLKDQSGHEVNCILRSIYTDLLHNSALFKNPRAGLGQVVTRLNRQLCASGFFEPDDFFTSVNVQIDHNTLALDYICAGHPPMLLVREGRAQLLPDPETGTAHLPIPFLETADYVSDRFQLKGRDQLILYTDGLTEMGMARTNATLSPEDLRGLVQEILDAFNRGSGDTMPVSLLVQTLLDRITGACGETVVPAGNDGHPVNTSADDVSLIGIEIEDARDWETHTLFPADDRAVSGFIKGIKAKIAGRFKDVPGLMDRIAMILEEGVLNAWNHGNGRDPSKSITVKAGFRNDIVMEVIDQGPGFDYNHLPDPTRMENIHKTHGRGLFIIRQFSDHVHWEGRGNHIFISLKKSWELPHATPSREQADITHLWKRISY